MGQVFRLQRDRRSKDKRIVEVVYFWTSLAPQHCSPQRLLQLVREHWRIENGLHHRRDATLNEDHAQLSMGCAPQVLAVLNNTVFGLFARQGETNVALAGREFAYHFDRALASLAA